MTTLRGPVPARHDPPVHARSRSRAARRPALAGGHVALLLALWLLTAAPAAAHDQLVGSDPPADAVLATPPSAVTLTFSAELIDISATVLAEGPGGAVVVGPPTVVGTQVSATLPADLPNGAYLVTWRVVSGDGHPIQGTVGFTVEAPVGTPAPTPTATPAGTPTPDPSTPPTAEPEPTVIATTGTTGPSPFLAVGTAGLLAVVTAVVVMLERRSRHGHPTSGDDS